VPLYDYVCSACNHRFEFIHGVHADGPTVCPACGGGPLRKGMTAPTVHFKGTGWAKKDRRPARTTTQPSTESTGSEVKTGEGSDAGVKAGGSEPAEKTSSTEPKGSTDSGSTTSAGSGANSKGDASSSTPTTSKD